ncbi:MAG: hypothetical protein IKB49_04370 [Alphaproteobacteria bacterium]|nr:hypothetical protein [Alphaproteobacteria bacterium]
MEKIFAVSMLAFFAIGAARAEWSPAYDYNNGNLNIATVKLVQEYAVPQDKVVNGNGVNYVALVQSTGETNAEADTQVPSLNAVAQTFVPSEPTSYVNTYGGEFSEHGMGKPVRGSYVLTADVDDNGNITYRWIGYGHTTD